MRRARTVAAWILLVGSIIGWPISQFTIAKGEPPFVLALSWLAIILTSADLLSALGSISAVSLYMIFGDVVWPAGGFPPG